MELHMPPVGVGMLESSKPPDEPWRWEDFLITPGSRAAVYLLRLAVAVVGLRMAFTTIPAVQASGCEDRSDDPWQLQSHFGLGFPLEYGNIDPGIYSRLSRSHEVCRDFLVPSTESLTQYTQNHHASARSLAAFIDHDLPCALQIDATGDAAARLRSVLSDGFDLKVEFQTRSATLMRWYNAAAPYFRCALEDAQTARDRSRMSESQISVQRHHLRPFSLAYKKELRRQNSAQSWFNEVSSIFANFEADGKALIADRNRVESLKREIFELSRSLDNDPPGPWNRTDASSLQEWYFLHVVGLGDRKLERASYEAKFDGLDCDPV